jgi:ATP-dependent exoDNAse (exonuclease V) beta subunit
MTEFTREQEEAIDIARLGEDACIVAGPGSGKTTVLVERYRRLVESGIDPSEIIAITFTEKAAANMRQKLSEAFQESEEKLRKLDRAHVSTIHAFCSRVLRDHATSAGVDPEFTILDEQVAAIEQARALRETLDELTLENRAGMNALLDATDGADFEGLIPNIYDAVRAAGVRPADLRGIPVPPRPPLQPILEAAARYELGFPARPNLAQRDARDLAKESIERILSARTDDELLVALTQAKFNKAPTNSAKQEIDAMRDSIADLQAWLLDASHKAERELLIEVFERFEARYRARKTALASLDFNDLELFAVRLLEENPAVRRQINEQYRQVMIDEFQDTSAQQSRLVGLVRGPDRFYAVGDLNQSIYGFRHASPAVFRGYHDSVKGRNGHAAELVENWRSRAAILRAAQLIMHGAPGITERDLAPAREFEERDHPSVEVMFFDRNEDEQEYALEAEWVATRIQELLVSLPARLSDFAVLVRNTAVLEAYLEALDRAGIEYNLNRRTGFLETREARDLMHLLRMIENPRDEVSTLAVLRSAFAGISDEGLLRMKEQAASFGRALVSPESVQLDAEDRARFDRFAKAFKGWRDASGYLPADRLLLRALDEMGIVWNPLSTTGANIEKFLTIARGRADKTLAEFLAYLEAMRKTDPREQDSPIDETRNAVQIMTTHAAKGLEFPVLFLVAMDKGTAGNDTPLNFTPEHGLGVKWSSPGLIHRLNLARIDQLDVEEGHRLLYVALTRAEDHLILSWSQKPDKVPKNWAKRVYKALGLDEVAASDQPVIRAYETPRGLPFEVRVVHSASRPEASGLDSATRDVAEVVVLERPVLNGQFDPNVTASGLSQFASCPRKYYLSSFLGWEGDLLRRRSFAVRSGESHDAAQIGIEVHSMLAGTEVSNPQMQSVALAGVFERSSFNKRLQKASRKEFEWDFVFGVGELIVRGTVDLWFEEPRGIVVVDYKTDDVSATDAAGRAEDYRVQLQVYGLALEAATGKPVREAWLHFLRPDVPVAVPLGNAAGIEQLGVDLISAEERPDFPLNPGPHCTRCEFFRNICPARLQLSEV